MRAGLDVANYFIEYSGYTKTNLQVLKMTYIAHGYMLAIHDKPLIGDMVEAWDYGPVIPSIFHAFKKWGLSPIGKASYSPDRFDDEQKEIIDDVFANYGKYCGYYLSQITHEHGSLTTPWKDCYRPGKNVVIPDEVTQKYYKKLIEN